MGPLRSLVFGFALSTLAASLIWTSPAHAAWPNDPQVNVRVCTDNNPRVGPSIATDGDGGAFVAWTDDRDSGVSGSDIYVQRITDRGTVASGWSATGLALCTASGSQNSTVIVPDGDGGAYVAWMDQRSGSFDIYATRVTADGVVAPGWPANGELVCGATGDQSDPRAAADGYGRMFLAWTDERNGNSDIYALLIEPDASLSTGWPADGRALCTDASGQTQLAIAADGVGGLLAVWEDTRNGDPDIYGTHVNVVGGLIPGWSTDGNGLATGPETQRTPILVADGTGGGVVVWAEETTVGYAIPALRFTSLGGVATGWSSGGIELSGQTQLFPALAGVPDGTGGVIVAWTDYNLESYGDIYARRIDGDGNLEGTTEGVPLCTVPYFQDTPAMVSDGVGGAIVAWSDSRSIAYSDVMGVRIDSHDDVMDGWVVNGTAISTAEGSQAVPRLVSDGAGGAIVAFGDSRSSLDVYVQRVDRFGRLGAQPTITAVTDVPNDQGGQVKVSWTASPLDAYPDYLIDNYRVLRSVPASALAGNVVDARRHGPVVLTTEDHGTLFSWELVGTVTALQTATYAFVAPTTGDSVSGSNPSTVFMVQARNADGTMWWFSDPDSGYSVDDLPPATPAPFAGSYVDGTTTLVWDPNAESDFAYYRLYRGTDVAFVPDAGNLVVEQSETGYVDTGGPYVYKLAAYDVHGNRSDYAVLIPNGTTDVQPEPSRGLWLAPGNPSPTSGGVALSFGLAREGTVVLAILDLGGREVNRLVDGVLPAGEHHLRWDGADRDGRPVPSGIYFAQLRADGTRLQKKLIVAR